MVQIDFQQLQSIDKIHYVLGMFKFVGFNFTFYSFKLAIWMVKKALWLVRDSLAMIYNQFR